MIFFQKASRHHPESFLKHNNINRKVS